MGIEYSFLNCLCIQELERELRLILNGPCEFILKNIMYTNFCDMLVSVSIYLSDETDDS